MKIIRLVSQSAMSGEKRRQLWLTSPHQHPGQGGGYIAQLRIWNLAHDKKYGCTLASETQSSRIILILYTINYRSYPVPFNMIQHVYTVVVSQKMWHKMCLTFLSQSLLLLLARVGFPQNNLLGRTKRVSLETKNLVKNEQIRRKNVLFVAYFLMNCL